MKSFTRKTVLFLILAFSLAIIGCGKDTPKAAESDQRELLNNASTLTVTGDLDDIVLDSDLIADGTVAGRIVERGFFNTKWTIMVLYLLSKGEMDLQHGRGQFR